MNIIDKDVGVAILISDIQVSVGKWKENSDKMANNIYKQNIIFYLLKVHNLFPKKFINKENKIAIA